MIAQATKNTITLKGSTEIVTEFFGYSINSILYQVLREHTAHALCSRPRALACIERASQHASMQTLRFCAVNGSCTRPARRPAYVHLRLEPDAPRPAMRCSER